jgi:hypothetical protein
VSPNQLKAAELIGAGLNHQEVADRIGVSRRTIVRWLGNPEFKNLCYGLRSRTPEHQHLSPIQSRIDSLTDWDLDDPLSREAAHRELRRLEWQISIAILQKALTSLENVEFSRPRDLVNCVEIASSLARRSGEIWSTDINAAISLLRRFDYDVVDRQILDEQIGINEDD